jgi:hypothetical protein
MVVEGGVTHTAPSEVSSSVAVIGDADKVSA